MSKTIMPPQRDYKRARSRRIFNRLFQPRENARLHEAEDISKNPLQRHWWTVTDLDPNGRHLYLLPGFRFANRLGFVETEHAWGGNADDHPPYVY